MDHLTWGQIEVDAAGVILSDVDGRDVPVHREWADVLVEARAAAGNLDEYMFYPKRKKHYTVAFSCCVVASQDQGLKPSLPRLRDT